MQSDPSTATGITTPGVTPAYSKKLVVVGDGGCGKTCLLISYSQGYFPQKYVPTVFENYISHQTHKGSGKTVELALWDTAGQEEYDRLRPLSYPETDVLFVCFAIDSPHSLDNVLDKWYPEVLHFCPQTPLVLVGLKSDLRQNRNVIELLKTHGMTPVSSQQGNEIAQRMSARYAECSSKEMIGVHEVFELAMDIAIGGNGKGGSGSTGPGGKKKKKKGCVIL
ncbi:P-loop containing nucleoside triphosphate hydrolase protein [Geopyxis carbonaria]|nr:P-loop containing nucleoside triphosphate hydrolase protein [Geopyxis carbonaria]